MGFPKAIEGGLREGETLTGKEREHYEGSGSWGVHGGSDYVLLGSVFMDEFKTRVELEDGPNGPRRGGMEVWNDK